MARTTLTPQDVVRGGLIHTFAAVDAVNGNQFDNDGRCALYVKNGGAGSIDATITVPGDVDGLAVADRVVSIGAGVDKLIGVFPPSIYNNSGKVYVDWSGGTSVTAAVIRF